ncbi:hypothetical protein PPERSA_03838 [Pseudocohnilembus persalinus]|uniref:Uncharacterized protein n=1 Tax=Pseudocohnilembus persalinus TaxID=266149 RepID=A0A0V0QUX0_PSEPJ|nr:hypothetical protein PPERSA_03838 [Pseudocohnilembus persalinus]|eukprot:KRX05901.1 hypothetical protein PPERSA_03838 [Pseudocohnilembus persalinus]
MQSQLNKNDIADEISIYVQLKQCTDRPTCKSVSDQETFLNQYQVVFLTKYRFQNYDYQQNQLQDATQEKYNMIDPNFFKIERINFKKTYLHVDNGYFLANESQREYINSYQEENRNFEKSFVYTRFPQYSADKKLYISSQYTLSLRSNELRIQYAKLTNIMAQASSLFQMLCIFGIFASFASEARLKEKIIETHLKYYYPKFQLQYLWDQKKDKFNFTLLQSSYFYFMSEFFPKKMAQKVQLLQQECDKINQNNMNQDKKIADSEKNTQNLQKQNLKKQYENQIKRETFLFSAYNKLYDVSKENLNVQNLYKQILELRTYVQLLYTEEEYAAVKFTGRKLPKIEQLNKLDPYSTSQLNHLEKLDLIDKDKDIYFDNDIMSTILLSPKTPQNEIDINKKHEQDSNKDTSIQVIKNDAQNIDSCENIDASIEQENQESVRGICINENSNVQILDFLKNDDSQSISDFEQIELQYSPISFQIFAADNIYPDNFVFDDYFKFQFIQGNLWADIDMEPQDAVNCKQEYPEKEEIYGENEYCIPKANLQLSSQLNKNGIAEEISFYVQLKSCTDKPTCRSVTDQEIFFNQYQAVLLTKYRLQNYNYQKNLLQDATQEKYNIIDPNLFKIERVNFEKTYLFVDNGYFLANESQMEYISSYYDESWIYDKSFVYSRFPQYSADKKLYISTQYTLSLRSNELRIQYAKLTNIMAQASSLFQMLCIFGIFASFAAEAKLKEKIIETHLKYYYPKFQLQYLWDQKKDKFNFTLLQSSYYYFMNEFFPKKMAQKVQMLQQECDKFKQNNINQDNKIVDVNKHQQIQSQQQHKIQQENLIKRETFLSSAYTKLYDVSKENSNVQNLYKQLLELRTYVQLLYTEEEYAAVKFTGRKLPKTQQLCQFDQYPTSQLNHLEKLDLIDKDKDVCQQKYQQFLIQFSKKQHGYQITRNYSQLSNIDLIKDLNNQKQNDIQYNTYQKMETLYENFIQHRIKDSLLTNQIKHNDNIQQIQETYRDENNYNQVEIFDKKIQKVQNLSNLNSQRSDYELLQHQYSSNQNILQNKKQIQSNDNNLINNSIKYNQHKNLQKPDTSSKDQDIDNNFFKQEKQNCNSNIIQSNQLSPKTPNNGVLIKKLQNLEQNQEASLKVENQELQDIETCENIEDSQEQKNEENIRGVCINENSNIQVLDLKNNDKNNTYSNNLKKLDENNNKKNKDQ